MDLQNMIDEKWKTHMYRYWFWKRAGSSEILMTKEEWYK